MICVIKINESSRVDLETLFHEKSIMFTRRSLGKKAIYVADLDEENHAIISARYSGVEVVTIDGVADYLEQHALTEPTQPLDYDESQDLASVEDEETRVIVSKGVKIFIGAVIVVLVGIALLVG